MLCRTVYQLFEADRKQDRKDEKLEEEDMDDAVQLRDEVPYCHYSSFVGVWRASSKTIKIRKYLRFAKCSECVRFREERAETRGDNARAELNARVRKHHLEVKAEREAYYQRRQLARQSPSRYLSMIIDGADQSRFHLPHLKETDHIR